MGVCRKKQSSPSSDKVWFVLNVKVPARVKNKEEHERAGNSKEIAWMPLLDFQKGLIITEQMDPIKRGRVCVLQRRLNCAPDKAFLQPRMNETSGESFVSFFRIRFKSTTSSAFPLFGSLLLLISAFFLQQYFASLVSTSQIDNLLLQAHRISIDNLLLQARRISIGNISLQVRRISTDHLLLQARRISIDNLSLQACRISILPPPPSSSQNEPPTTWTAARISATSSRDRYNREGSCLRPQRELRILLLLRCCRHDRPRRVELSSVRNLQHLFEWG